MLARSQIDGARAHERQVLIQALLAELRWLSGMLDHTSAAVKDQKPEPTVLVFPRFKTPILERSLDRLGLLPKDSIGSVLGAYAGMGELSEMFERLRPKDDPMMIVGLKADYVPEVLDVLEINKRSVDEAIGRLEA